MIRVLMITTTHSWDDTRIFHLESVGLGRLGMSVSILAVRETVEPTESCGIRLISGRGSKTRLGRFMINPLRAFHYCLEHQREFDVFHFHDPEFLPYGALLARLVRRPVIYDMHEFLPEILLRRDWVPLHLNRAFSAIANLIERLCVRGLQNVVAMNELGACRAKELGAKHVTVYMGLPSKQVALESNPVDITRKGVVYVGGITADRGADLMALVAPEILRRCGAATHVAGPLRDESARRLVFTEGVQYVGILDRPTVLELLRSSAVGWIPLRRTPNHDKTWLLKLGEYMATGLPVVISNLNYAGAVVKRYGCGLVVDADNPNAHRDALIQLLTDRDTARAMGERGRQAIINEMNAELFTDRLRSFYSTLIPR